MRWWRLAICYGYKLSKSCQVCSFRKKGCLNVHWWIKSMLGWKCTDHLIMRWENLYHCTHDRLSYLTYHMTENVHPKWSWSYVTIFSFSARFIFTPLAFMYLIPNYSSWLQQTQMVVVRIIRDQISYVIIISYIHIHMCPIQRKL